MESSEQQEQAAGEGESQGQTLAADAQAGTPTSGESPAEALARQLFFLTIIGTVLYVGAVFIFGQ